MLNLLALKISQVHTFKNKRCKNNLCLALTTCTCIFAAILGMYTLMSNKQYYDALGATGKIANTEGINSTYSSHIHFFSIIYVIILCFP